ncbi:hypothetical protein MMC10_005354 [Thelotrema lepadinum]|nr:hypothetical protein [Thelotrema lepadinum]
MSWNYQQPAFDSQSSFGNAGQWGNQTETSGNHPEASPYSYGYNAPQAANMEYDIHVKIEPPEPIPYGHDGRELSQGDSFNRKNRVDPFQNADHFQPYRPANQQSPMASFNYGNDAQDGFNNATLDYSQGQGYHMETGQRLDTDGQQQQQRVDSTETHHAGVQPYAPYQPYRSDVNLGYGMEGTQHPPLPPQNISLGTLQQDNGTSTMREDHRDEVGFDARPNSLPGYNRMDAPNFEVDIGFKAAPQSSEMQGSELRFTPAPITERDYSTGSYKDPTASTESVQMQPLTSSARQQEKALDLSSENRLSSDSSRSLPNQNDHASAQPSAEQRARWELIRTLVKGNDHSEKEEHQESRDSREKSPNMSPRAGQNQPQQGSVPVRSPSKGMRTLMLPQMVERRKSLEAIRVGKNRSPTPEQGQAENAGPQHPSQLQNTPSKFPVDGKFAKQPSTIKQPAGSPQAQGPQQPSTPSGSMFDKPAVPPRVALTAASHPMTASPGQLGGHGQNQPVPQKPSANSTQQPSPIKATGSPGQNTNNSHHNAAPSATKSSSNPAAAAASQPIQTPKPAPSSGQNAPQSRPGERAATAPSQPRKPVPSPATASAPTKAPPQGQAAPHPSTPRLAPKPPSSNPAAGTKPATGAATLMPRSPQAQAASPSSKPAQTPATAPLATNKAATTPSGGPPMSSSHPNPTPRAPQQNTKAPPSINRAAPAGSSTSALQNPTKSGNPRHLPPTTPSSSQSKPVSQSPTPLPASTPQQSAPPQRSVPQGRSAVQHSSTPQQPSAQQPIPPNQPRAAIAARGLPSNPTVTASEQPPSRSKGSLGRSGAVSRRTSPQEGTGAANPLGSPSTPHQVTPSRQPTNANPHSIPSPERQERSREPYAKPPNYKNDDEDSVEERDNHIPEALPGVLGQLAASQEAGVVADPELEANNLVHLFMYGTTLMLKSFVGGSDTGLGGVMFSRS